MTSGITNFDFPNAISVKNNFDVGKILDTLNELDGEGLWPEDVSRSSSVDALKQAIVHLTSPGADADRVSASGDRFAVARELEAMASSGSRASVMYQAFCVGAWQHVKRKYADAPEPTLDDDETAVLSHCIRCDLIENETDGRWSRVLDRLAYDVTPEIADRNEQRFIDFYTRNPREFAVVSAHIASVGCDDADVFYDAMAHHPPDDDHLDDEFYDAMAHHHPDDEFHDAPAPSDVREFMEALADTEQSRLAVRASLEARSLHGGPIDAVETIVEHFEAESRLIEHPITRRLGLDLREDGAGESPRSMLGALRSTLSSCHRIVATSRDGILAKVARVVLRSCRSMLVACLTGRSVLSIFMDLVDGVYALVRMHTELAVEALMLLTWTVRLICGIGMQLPGAWRVASSSIWFRVAKATVRLPFSVVKGLLWVLWSTARYLLLRPSKPAPPAPVGRRTPAPSRRSTSPPRRAIRVDDEPGSLRPTQAKPTKRCPGESPTYCTSGQQTGWCVNNPRHCDMVWDLGEFRRRKPTSDGTGDVSTGLRRRRT